VHRIRSSIIAGVIAGGLSACEHATGPQPRVRVEPAAASASSPRYSAAITEMAKMSGLDPADLVLLMEMGGESEKASASGTPSLPAIGHPLDEVAKAQIHELFTAAGLRAEDYLPRKP